MNILENVLKKFVDVSNDLYEVTNKHIIEVDDYLPLIDANKLVIGHVLTCVDHPNSDHLHITTVDVGGEVLQIVCGAKNVAAGQTVIVALPGTILPGNFEIKKSAIRGVESNGMICSLRELGFDDKYVPDAYKDGIYVFDEAIKPGTDAIKYLGLDGHKVVLGMTPNRGDLLSHLGFAYDLAAVLNKQVKLPKYDIKTINKKNPLTVKIDTKACLKYDARVMEVTIKESPWWLKNALIQSDIRPINNVVDITNYILITYGTPLHAFDFNKVNSNSIVVRLANKGEKVVTLDDETRILTEDDIVITDSKRPIALGGVMGLSNTMIDEHSTKIILEAALFDPAYIARTSKRLNLKSDSSLRFERGIDYHRVHLGLEAATQLLIELADAKVYEGISSDSSHTPEKNWIKTSFEYLNNRLGTKLSNDEILSLFKRLNYEVKTEQGLTVAAPLYRKDILIEADLVEELARIYGYDRIPHHKLILSSRGGLTKTQKQLRELRHLLADLGLNETINYSITGDIEGYPTIGETIEILMPMSDEKKFLRQSLIPGLISTVSYHQTRQMMDVAIFEMGHVFAKGVEVNHLAVAVSGSLLKSSWQKHEIVADYYALKGILDVVAERLKVELNLKATQVIPSLHPGIQGEIIYQNQVVGYIGKLHPTYEKKFDVSDVYVFEVNLEALTGKNINITFEPVTKFPTVTRDISFIISQEYPIGEVLALIRQTGRKIIADVELFDVYKGEHVKEGYQSLAVSITFQNKEKTFEKEDIEKALKSIKNRLNFTYKAEVRD